MVLSDPVYRCTGSARHTRRAAQRGVCVAEQTPDHLGEIKSDRLPAGLFGTAVVLLRGKSFAFQLDVLIDPKGVRGGKMVTPRSGV
jgi:hypothetical protein